MSTLKVLSITLPDGQHASLESSDGRSVRVHSPLSAPPGATLRARVSAPAESVEVKVRSCRRLPDSEPPVFLIEGRLQNATRELRAALAGEP
jgi:hypothetical protein